MGLEIERVLDSFFSFTLDDGEPIIEASPTATFFGTICHFKTKNGANIIKNQSIDVSDVSVIDTFGGTGTFTYNNVQSLIEKLDTLNFFQDRVTGGSGSTMFQTLSDTFSFFGHDGKIPVVDEAQQKLVPTAFNNFSKIIELGDVSIESFVKGKYLSIGEVDGELKVVLADINTTNTSSTTLKRIEYTADGTETTINVDNKPNAIFLFKNSTWQIEGLDFTYELGVITPLQTIVDEDYFEIIPLSNSVKKYLIKATSNNQTEWSFDGNPAFADVYLKGSRLREGVDYSRTLFSNNNKIVIINQSLINDIEIDDILEVITY